MEAGEPLGQFVLSLQDIAKIDVGADQEFLGIIGSRCEHLPIERRGFGPLTDLQALCGTLIQSGNRVHGGIIP